MLVIDEVGVELLDVWRGLGAQLAAEVEVPLVGEGAKGSSFLLQRLEERRCQGYFATSFQEACLLLGQQSFDLLLSTIRLQNGAICLLIALLGASRGSFFYSHPVEDSCWWLPVVKHGQTSLGHLCFGRENLLTYSISLCKKSS